VRRIQPEALRAALQSLVEPGSDLASAPAAAGHAEALTAPTARRKASCQRHDFGGIRRLADGQLADVKAGRVQ
jgi:hypothetical protein